MKAIACRAKNGVIGKDGKMPWHYPEDLKFFKEQTYNKAILVGRKTADNLPPLKNRMVCVLSKKQTIPICIDLKKTEKGFDASYLRVFMSADFLAGFEAGTIEGINRPEKLEDGIDWLCGGASMYEQFLPRCKELYLTTLKKDFEGDVFFPKFDHLFTLKQKLIETEDLIIEQYGRTNI